MTSTLNPTSVDAENPWPGLSSFTEDARGFFFGREKETEELFRLVGRQTLTVLFGQSGLGKSSLIHAGLFPRLRESDHLPLYLRLDHDPGSPPLADQVKAALNEAFTKEKAEAPAFSAEESLWEYFHRKDVDIWSAKHRLLTPILAFDQFEEIFTLGRADDARRERSRAFLSELACLVENRPPPAVQAKLDAGIPPDDGGALSLSNGLDPAKFNYNNPSCRVILSLREDFLPDLEGLKRDMPALVHNRLRLKRLSGTQALEIVSRPAPHLLAPGVAERIVEFVAGGRGGSSEALAELDVEPALLSVICRELNERRSAKGGAQITAEQVSGDRREILNDFYERSMADMPEPMRHFVEDRLLTKSGFRDNLALESALEIPGVTRPLVDTLVSRRLLRIEDRLGVQRVELTHDVLAEVIRASRDARQQRMELERMREREGRVLAEAARRTRRLRVAVGALAALVLLLAAGGLYGLSLRKLEFQRIARIDVGIATRLLSEGKTSEGLAYLLRAARRDPHNSTIAPRLVSILTAHNFLLPQGVPLEHAARVLWTDYSDDGRFQGVLWRDGSYGTIDRATGALEKSQLPSPPNLNISHFVTRNFVVVRCQDNVLRVLDRSGRLVREIHPGRSILAMTSRGTYGDVFFARLDNETAIFCDAATGRTIGGPIPYVSIRDYALAYEKWVQWSVTTGIVSNLSLPTEVNLRSVETETDIKMEFPFGLYDWVPSPDGRRAVAVQRASQDNQALTLGFYSLPGGELVGSVRRMEGAETGQVGWPFYSPDGRYVVTWYNTLEIWDAENGRRITSVPLAGPYTADRLAFSPDRRTLATWGNPGSVELWDLATGNPRAPALKHGSNVTGAEFSSDGRIFRTHDNAGLLRLWDVSTGRLLAEPAFMLVATGAKLSPDAEEMAIGTPKGAVFHLRLAHGEATSLVLPKSSSPFVSVFLPGNPSRVLFPSPDRTRIFDVTSGSESTDGFSNPSPIPEMTNAFSAPRLRSDGKVMVLRLSGLNTQGVWQAWWLDAGKVIRIVDLENLTAGPGGAVVFSASGDVAGVAWNTQFLGAWDLNSGKPLGPRVDLPPGSLSQSTVAVDREARRITAGASDGIGKIWDTATGKEILRIEGQGSRFTSIQFSPDGTRIATGDDQGLVQLLDSRTGTPIGSPMVHNASITSVLFTPDGRLQTNSSDGAVRMWNADTGDPLTEPMPNSAGTLVQLSSDASRIVAFSPDGVARVWDAASGLPVTESMTHGRPVTRGDLSPDGRFMRTVAVQGTSWKNQLWSVPPPLPAGERTPQWLLALAAAYAGRVLNDDGNLVPSSGFDGMEELRRTISALPDGAPYADWGKWLIADPATRSIAPGFTITPAEAAKLAAE